MHQIKNKVLATGLLLALSCPMGAMAQSNTYDDRWYATVGAGANIQDSARETRNVPFGTLGVGKFINPNWSLDAEVNYQNGKADRNSHLTHPQYGISLDARRHFRVEGRRFNPYIVMGVGLQREEEEFEVAAIDSPHRHHFNTPTAKLGVGAQMDFAKMSLRGELAARASFDQDPVHNPHNKNTFVDGLASLTAVIPLGSSRSAEVMPAPVVEGPLCSDKDSDNDGVNDCNDQCPASVSGQTVNDAGCPQSITIDLRGVNFDFDRATLRPDAIGVLDNAVSILNQYPTIKVNVEGHTDLCGSEGYNQNLSERRALAVYDYLVKSGISTSRLEGPFGYGESRPLVDTPQSFPACENEVNRRTELNVRN